MTKGGDLDQLEPAILVIFGITGDLSQRYLLPALYRLIKAGRLPQQTVILGISRRQVKITEVINEDRLCANDADTECDPEILNNLRSRTSMFQMDLDDPAAYDALLNKLNDIETDKGICLNRLYYLSIPPTAYDAVVRLLGERGLNTSCQHGNAATRLMVEKPFGHDLASAKELIVETARHFQEEQIYRIDHYMPKPAVLDLLNSRFKDTELDKVWNSGNVASVEIAAKETIGIEGRAEFYDPVGALRDFVQSHLVQILGLVVMDKPESLDSDHLHAAKEAGLEQIEPVPADKAGSRAQRGQYESYRQEVNKPESTTETFAAVTVYSQNPRWQGVPITMVTGKALNERTTRIAAKLKQPLGSGKTEIIWSSQGGNTYERVLLDAIKGDRTLFSSSREILASWRILQPVLDAWQKSAGDLIIYESGSAGPAPESAKL
jgi:glucose-6-phosphate 1-dehydrogenase